MLELLGQAPVGLKSSIFGILVQTRIPVIEFVEAVSEAKTFLHGQITQIALGAAFDEALVVQILAECEVFLHHCSEVVLSAELTCLKFLQSKSKGVNH